MATTTALMPSPTFNSAFSPYTDSPSSPNHFALLFRGMQRQSGLSDSLAPPPSPYPATVDPSPVESTKSTSTDATDIELDGARHDIDDAKSPDIELISPSMGALSRLDTSPATTGTIGPNDDPQSVIHIPSGFRQFTRPALPTHEEETTRIGQMDFAGRRPDRKRSMSLVRSKTSPTGVPERAASAMGYISDYRTPQYAGASINHRENAATAFQQPQRRSTVPINTHVPPARTGAGSTPRASTQEEADAEWRRTGGFGEEVELSDEPPPITPNPATVPESRSSTGSTESEITALKSALTECWSLCNTLAKMSSNQRQRMFNFSNNGVVQEQAWKSCWALCQKLYDTRDENSELHVKQVLDLSRDFCTALFEARERGDPVKDSILRVSFELNNHLYNTRNPNLPEAFTERTLEFYVTLCHRLIKDSTALPEDTDYLLRSCWNLAECLFTFRERNQQNRPVDEETLSSAVQACWDLSDIFRERWSSQRPDRGTPRAQQRGFPPSTYSSYSTTSQAYSASIPARPHSTLSGADSYRGSFFNNPTLPPPETPTTIFDEGDDSDRMRSPAEPSVPNILVYGTEPSARTSRWDSSVSVASSQSERSYNSNHSNRTAKGRANRGRNSAQTSPKSVASTSTRDGGSHQQSAQVTAIKALIIKAALNKGYPRNNMNPQSLQNFVRNLPPNSFGMEPWQRQLLDHYKRSIFTEPFMQESISVPSGRRYGALEIAYAVRWIDKNENYRWLSALYETVFGFTADDAEANSRTGLTV